MYVCENCDGRFEEPAVTIIQHTELDSGITSEGVTVCPYCGDECFSELLACQLCGEYKDGNFVCDDCLAEISCDLDAFIDMEMSKFRLWPVQRDFVIDAIVEAIALR